MAKKPAKRKPAKPAKATDAKPKQKRKRAAAKPAAAPAAKPRSGAARKGDTETRETPKKRGRRKRKSKSAAAPKPTPRPEPPAPPPVGEYAEPWMGKFIDHLRNGGTVAAACGLAVVGRATAYRHRQKDETFAVAWADAEEESTERLEEEAFYRAVKGVEKPIHYEGRRIDFVREYSDTLLIFLLKARKPETYRDRIDHRHSGGISRPGGSSATVQPGSLDLTRLTNEEIDTLERIQAKATQTEEAQT